MTRNAIALPALLSALVGLVAGLAVGFVLGSSSGPALAAERAVSIDRGDSEPRAGGTAGDTRLSTPTPGTGGPRRAETSAPASFQGPSAGEIDRAVSRIDAPVVAAPTGTGEVRGKVVSRTGDPIPGVAVRLTPAQPGASATRMSSEARPSSAPARSLDEALRRAAREWSEGPGRGATATTDAEGAFVVRGLGEGGFEVTAEADGWRFSVKGARLVSSGESVEVVGRPMASVEVMLSASDGTSLRQALLLLDLGQGSEWVDWSADSPTVFADSAQFELQAWADLYPTRLAGQPAARLVSPKVAVDGRVDAGRVQLVLEPTVTVTGRVLGDTAGGSSRTEVFALPLAPNAPFDPTVEVSGATTARDRNGLFVFTQLLPGRHAIGVIGPDGLPSDHEIVELGFGLTELEFERPGPEAGKWITLRCLSPAGTPVERVNAWLEVQESAGKLERLWTNSRAEDDGSTLISLEGVDAVDLGDIPAGTRAWVVASSSVYGRGRVEISSGQRSAEIRFEVPCELRVRIEGDISMGGYVVRVLDAASDREDPPQVASASQGSGLTSRNRIDASGLAHLRGLTPGPVTVVLGRTGQGWGAGIELAREDIVLSGVEHELVFQAVDLCDITVIVTPAGEERWLALERTKDDGEVDRVASGNVGDDGRIVLRGIAPGAYTLKDYSTGAKIDVVAPVGEVRFDVTDHVKKLRVSVSKADGQLAAWGFLGGDLITSVAGEPVDDDDALLDLLDLQSVTVTVERGEETLDIEIPRYPKDTRGKTPLGGWIYVGS